MNDENHHIQVLRFRNGEGTNEARKMRNRRPVIVIVCLIVLRSDVTSRSIVQIMRSALDCRSALAGFSKCLREQNLTLPCWQEPKEAELFWIVDHCLAVIGVDKGNFGSVHGAGWQKTVR